MSEEASAFVRFHTLLGEAVAGGTLLKLTLGKYRGSDASLKNIFVRPVVLKAGPQLSFVYRHATKDVTKNLPHGEALALIESLLGNEFLDAHLFTPLQTVQLEQSAEGKAKLFVKTGERAPAVGSEGHDRERNHLISANAPWLRRLGITNERGQPREGMAAKFRQISKFVELLSHFSSEAPLPKGKFRLVDMGCGKGYLTFAAAAHFAQRAEVVGVEARPELVGFCENTAREEKLENLHFTAGTIESYDAAGTDVLIALHACDTATDDALAKGIAAGAALILVSPCCQKELRPQLKAPVVLAEPLRHGIFQERQAEFVTDALRAALLEWAGYRTKVFEFVSTEHTAKNLVIAAIRTPNRVGAEMETKIRALARFYGIKRQKLAEHLKFVLEP
jgi:SAM-dependent methyltransferase